MKLASLIVSLVVALASCSDKQPAAPPAPAATPVAQPAPTPPPPAAIPAPAAPPPAAPPPEASDAPLPADFPAPCVTYAALIDKLKACDKLGAARDGLMVGYTSLRSAWSAVPADQRPAFGAQCQTQADSLRNAVAATCAW